VRGLAAIRKIQPVPQEFAAVLFEVPDASIHPVCFEVIDANAVMHARHFSSPSSGTLEDPVTGTASGVLGAYYREFVDRREQVVQPLIIEQGYEMGREGRVLAWANRNGVSYDVRIAGTACFVDQLTI
jgi:PhzF family phenazine biosynthesis protein